LRRTLSLSVSLVSWLVVGACGLSDPMAGASVDQALEAPNGMSLNGMSLNGMSLNGMSLNGMSLNGMSLNGMSLNGMSLNGMSLNGTSLTGTVDGQTVAGADLVGAQLVGLLANGDTLPLRIDSAATLPSPNTDVWAYGVSYQTADGWSPMCGSNPSGPILAVPVAGTFNYGWGVAGGGSYTADSSSFTFGCRGTAIAKCVELGYKPWQEVDGASLAPAMVACTRMLRADYCGDGTSYTVNGTPINLYDRWDIQTDTESWPVEAEWTADGAACIQAVEQTRGWNLRGLTPSCSAALIDASCGDPAAFLSGHSLLIDEYQSSQ
jgi:ADYC domain-containing protein